MFGVNHIKEKIIFNLKKTIEDNFGKDILEEKDFLIELSKENQFGDFSWSSFKLAKKINKKPNQVASELAHLMEAMEIIEKIESIGPYLNFYLNKEKWFQLVLSEVIEQEEKFGQWENKNPQKIIVEFSAPNTNKPQHLGHLRNALLGDSLSNIFKQIGQKVTRANLINDRGIHITKSMLAYQIWGENKTPETEHKKPDHFVGYFYSLFDQKAKENPKLLTQAQEMLKKWEESDQEVWALWQRMNGWAMKGFEETYKKLSITFDKWYYESETYKLGREIVKKSLEKKICYQREDGAIEIDLEKYGLGKKILIRADGTSIYITQDLGLAKLKYDEYKPDLSLYVVGSEQNYHFQVLFAVLKEFGFDWVDNCHHLSYGLVYLPEGKMKSREGKVVEVDDLIYQVKQIAKGEILKREKDILPTELETRSEKITLASIKFFFLRFKPEEDIYYNPNQEVSFEGATGPYLQYTYARIQGILIKKSITKEEKVDFSLLGNQEEITLLRLIYNFPEVIQQSAQLYNPAHLANYLLELCQKFNSFYHQHHILQGEEKLKKARLVLIKSVAQVLKNGLGILGIEVLERM